MKRSGLVLVVVFVVCSGVVLAKQWPEWEDALLAERQGWIQGLEAPRSAPIEFLIGLRLRNADKLEKLLMEVSDPRSAQYGKHYSKEQMYELTRPYQSTIDQVTQWLESVNPLQIQVLNQGGFIRVKLTVEQAMELFSETSQNEESHSSLDFRFYRHHLARERIIIRSATPISIPEELQSIIQLVADLNDFPC